VSPVARPEKRTEPVVLPVICVVDDVVVLSSVMVLDTALGSGVYVTVIDVVELWLSVGAAGVANCGRVSVTGDDIAPSAELENEPPSPMDVTVAVYVSPVMSVVNENEPIATTDWVLDNVPFW
jgi:hypothetical protein